MQPPRSSARRKKVVRKLSIDECQGDSTAFLSSNREIDERLAYAKRKKQLAVRKATASHIEWILYRHPPRETEKDEPALALPQYIYFVKEGCKAVLSHVVYHPQSGRVMYAFVHFVYLSELYRNNPQVLGPFADLCPRLFASLESAYAALRSGEEKEKPKRGGGGAGAAQRMDVWDYVRVQVQLGATGETIHVPLSLYLPDKKRGIKNLVNCDVSQYLETVLLTSPVRV